MNRATPHVVIVGGGFAGRWCTRALASAPARITLVDKANHHMFQPLLYQVATVGLSAPDIAAPLWHILCRQRNMQVLMAEVSGIDVDGMTVQLGRPVASQTLHDDQRLVASSATHAYFGHDEWAANAPGLKTLDDALANRRRVLLAFEQAEAAASEKERRAYLRLSDFLFVVILGDAAQNGMIGSATSASDGMVLIGTLVFWSYMLDFMSFQFTVIQRFTAAPRLCLVRDGRLMRRNMRRELITDEELKAKIRQEGVDDLATVKRMYLEADGEMSLIRNEEPKGAA